MPFSQQGISITIIYHINFHMKVIPFILCLICCSFAPIRAQEAKPIRLLVAGALELGGDEVAEVFFTNGESQSVNAGQGGSLFVGGQFQLPAVNLFFARASVGFKYVTTQAENVNIRMTRVPIHLTGHVRVAEDFHLGGGLALHQSTRFKADGLGDDVKFDSAAGPRIEVGWKGLALTYTNMSYTADNGNTYDASNFGLSFTATFPK